MYYLQDMIFFLEGDNGNKIPITICINFQTQPKTLRIRYFEVYISVTTPHVACQLLYLFLFCWQNIMAAVNKIPDSKLRQNYLFKCLKYFIAIVYRCFWVVASNLLGTRVFRCSIEQGSATFWMQLASAV